MEGEAATSQDKLARLLEDGKISQEQYEQLASAMHRHAPAGHHEAAEPRERLRKDVGRAWIAGVCAGLARHFNTDPVVPRIVAVAALFILGPAPVLLYLLLCAMMPWDDPEAARAARANAHPFRFTVLVALLVVILPFFYCAFVVPRVVSIYAGLDATLCTGSRLAISAAFGYQNWAVIWMAALAVFLSSALYHVICNNRFRRIFERLVIWPGILWLLFLVIGTALPLISMARSIE